MNQSKPSVPATTLTRLGHMVRTVQLRGSCAAQSYIEQAHTPHDTVHGGIASAKGHQFDTPELHLASEPQ